MYLEQFHIVDLLISWGASVQAVGIQFCVMYTREYVCMCVYIRVCVCVCVCVCECTSGGRNILYYV